MRILMVAQSFSPIVGGEERIVEDLSAELARRGHEVEVATLRQPLGEPPPREDGVGVELLESSVHRIPGVAGRRGTPLRAAGAGPALGPRPAPGHPPSSSPTSSTPTTGWSTPTCRWTWRADAAFVLSLHDYSLVCATKRFFYKGGVCSGPAAAQVPGPLGRVSTAPPKGRSSPPGCGRPSPGCAAGSTCSCRSARRSAELSGLDERVAHRVVPNFIGELPAPPPADDPRLAALPEEPFVLYFGDVAEDKGVGKLVEAYAGLEDAPPLVLIGRQLIDGVADVPGRRRPRTRCRTRW